MEYFRSKDWDIIGKTRLWFTLSAVLIVAGLITWGARGLNFGIDFTGGSLHRYAFEQPLAANDSEVPGVLAQVRGALSQLGLTNAQIQVVGGDQGQLNSLYIRASEVANDEEAAKRDAQIQTALGKIFASKGAILDLGRETVGPVVGRELQANALLALILGWALILIYITVRYEFRFAVAGIVALVHDALIVVGLMALFHVELDTESGPREEVIDVQRTYIYQ